MGMIAILSLLEILCDTFLQYFDIGANVLVISNEAMNVATIDLGILYRVR